MNECVVSVCVCVLVCVWLFGWLEFLISAKLDNCLDILHFWYIITIDIYRYVFTKICNTNQNEWNVFFILF